jgi:acyl carrier protein
VREGIKEVMARVLGVAAGAIPDDASPDVVPQWDSLRHLELMLAIEAQAAAYRSIS